MVNAIFFKTKVLCQSQRLIVIERAHLLSQGHLECAGTVSLSMNSHKPNPSRLTEYIQLINSNVQEAEVDQ